MNRIFLIKIFICIFLFSIFLYKNISKSNALTEYKLTLPKLQKEIYQIKEDNKNLKYIIDQFENPVHLMELVRRPEYSHLKHPLVKDICKIKEGVVLKENKVENSSYKVDNNISY